MHGAVFTHIHEREGYAKCYEEKLLPALAENDREIQRQADGWKNAFDIGHDWQERAKELEKEAAEKDKVIEGLRKFIGPDPQHKPGCDAVPRAWEEPPYRKMDCTCGLDEVKRALAPEPR